MRSSGHVLLRSFYYANTFQFNPPTNLSGNKKLEHDADIKTVVKNYHQT
jgi:hypothetical protein